MGTDVNALADSAQVLYDKGSYRLALENYQKLEAQNVLDSELFYNIGNCFTRLGDLGHAKLYFERALLFSPNNVDAQHNLDWIQMRLTDELVDPQPGLMEWLGSILRGQLATDQWILLSLGVLVATCTLLVLRKTSIPKISWRWPLTTSLVALFLASLSWLSVPRINKSIVIGPTSYGYSAPTESSKKLIALSAGSAGKVLESKGDWTQMELSDGRRAWFLSDQWKAIGIDRTVNY